jgi:hypothetical protein
LLTLGVEGAYGTSGLGVEVAECHSSAMELLALGVGGIWEVVSCVSFTSSSEEEDESAAKSSMACQTVVSWSFSTKADDERIGFGLISI